MGLSQWIHGSKPDVAPYTPTIFGEEQIKAILANIEAWPDIEKLGTLYQDYMVDKFRDAGLDIEGLIEGGGRVTSELISKAGEMAQGKIPADVIGQVMRSSAFQNIVSGLWGGAQGGANQARNLGLTSLGMIQKGASLLGEAGNAAQRWAGVASGMIMNPAGMLITPEKQAAITMQNNLYKQATQQLRYNIAAAPDPQWADRAKMVASLLGSFAGPGGAQMGQYASGSYGQQFGGASGGTGPAITAGGSQPTDPNNPGFFSNFSTAYRGGDSQGVGGWLGTIWPGGTTPTAGGSDMGSGANFGTFN